MRPLAVAVYLLLAPAAGAADLAKLTLIVHPVYDDAPLVLDASFHRPTGETITITRLAYLLSEPGVRATADGEWLTSHNWFAFGDAAKNATTHELENLPRGAYNALKFYVGPDAATDKADPSGYPAQHALNPLVNGLHWGWAGGFVYLALEGHASSAQGGFSYHLAGAENRMEVTLPLALDLTHDTTVELDFHVDRLLPGRVTAQVAEQNSTHSRATDTLARQIATRTESAFTVRSITATARSQSAGQTPIVNREGTPYTLQIPRGVPVPDLPTDFPLTQERVALGRRLFHETRLSQNRTQSCASCHDAAFAFGDRRRFSVGAEGRLGERNSMPLFNLAWKTDFFWDGRSPSLRKQALDPIQNPIEMHARLDDVEARLTSDRSYAADFARAFGTPGVSVERVGIALEAFVMTLTSFDSRFDRASRGEAQLSETEKRGFQLFMTEYDPRQNQFGADCFHCHSGALFTDHQFHNNGLRFDPRDTGRERVTHRDSDEGKFSTPSLRNVALTAPYMHDGRFGTLAEVIAHYDHGVENRGTLDPNLAKHPVAGIRLSAEDQRALVAFLETLTDAQFTSSVANPARRGDF